MTRVNLTRLARCGSVTEVLEDARRHPVVPITPEIVKAAGGTILRIPTGLGYELTEAPVAPVGGVRLP